MDSMIKRVFIALCLCSALIAASAQAQQSDKDASAQEREAMVEGIAGSGITDKNLLAAFRTVPRHMFVPDYARNLAYKDVLIPLGGGIILAEPSVYAKMLNSLVLRKEHRVLVVGNGTGYLAALLSQLVEAVFVVEGSKDLAEKERSYFTSSGIGNVSVQNALLYTHFKNQGPFSAIFVHGAVQELPSSLLAQMDRAGRTILALAAPSGFQMLVKIRNEEQSFSIQSFGECFFHALTGFE